MLGMFGIFGRSQEIKRLDDALRAAGLHPRLVPDAVKIATIKQLKEAGRGTAEPHACAKAAELLSYCILGPRGFIEETDDPVKIDAVEARIDAAVDSGQGLDARLVLLTLQAGITHPSVIERYRLAIER
jgi:hypothetical protein